MPQLHLYVPDEVAKRLREQAKAKKISLSKHLAEIVQRETPTGWPEGYFEEVVGGWIGDFEEPEDLPLEERDPL
ncbi:hypothetical protein BH24DEI2_BH24DEI2_25220 [soil metagenome]